MEVENNIIFVMSWDDHGLQFRQAEGRTRQKNRLACHVILRSEQESNHFNTIITEKMHEIVYVFVFFWPAFFFKEENLIF